MVYLVCGKKCKGVIGFMKKWVFCVANIFISILLLIGCSNNVNDNDKEEIKKVIDTVLSYDGGYDVNVNKYVSKDTFYDSNYVVFYSYFLGDTDLTKYESEVKSIEKEGDQYIAYMVINMEAVGELIGEEDGEEEVDEPEAEGNNVPVEVVLSKKDGQFYIEKVKEYDSLQEAKKEHEGFK